MTGERPPLKADIRVLAWEIHRRNGHQPGYDGPCWGPTLAELKQAEQELTGVA